jgi:hypothetical protein
MALINCPECGKQVSDKAEKCPNCAYPINPTAQITANNQPIKTEPVKVKEYKKSSSFSALHLILVLIAGSILTIVFRELTTDKNTKLTKKDKNVKMGAEFTQYNLFESTFFIQSPFKLKEEVASIQIPELYDKVFMATYQSRNITFIIAALKVKTIYSGKVDENFEETVKSILDNADKQKDLKSEITYKEDKIINNVAFRHYSGMSRPIIRNHLGVDEYDYHFDVYFTITPKYAYIIFFDENLGNADIQIITYV